MAGVITLEMTNDAIGSGNPALVSFDTGVPVADEPRVLAQMIQYMIQSAACAVNTRVKSARIRRQGAAGAVDMPFPAVPFNLISVGIGTASSASYNFAFGTGGLTPLGTSLTVQEKTSLPGRSTTGRHYVPFVSALNIRAGGDVDPIQVNRTQGTFQLFGQLPGAATPSYLGPALLRVTSQKLNLSTLIEQAKCSSIASNLSSRRR